jgi:hypothetical protein
MTGEKGVPKPHSVLIGQCRLPHLRVPQAQPLSRSPRLHFCPFLDPLTVAPSSPFGPFVGRSIPNFVALLTETDWQQQAQYSNWYTDWCIFFRRVAKSQVLNPAVALRFPLSLKPPGSAWLFHQTPDVILQGDRQFHDPSNHPCFCPLAGELSGPWAPTQTPATVVIIVLPFKAGLVWWVTNEWVARSS